MHRPFKEFDRVCEQHFREEDILRYWEHNINGKIERIERNKQSLKPNSVPVFVEVEETPEESPKRKQKKTDTESSKSKVNDGPVYEEHRSVYRSYKQL